MTAEPVIDAQDTLATVVVPPTVRASLSPSRAADFKTCPLLYRFRSIDRLPERPTVEQARGTLVHAVLERLFDLPAAARTPESAGDLVAPQWDRLVTEEPELAGLFAEGDAVGVAEFLRSAAALLEGYFAVEDPRRLEPAEREALISAVVDDELLIRGYLDRLDVAPDGALRVVDYKTGGAPREAFEARALFQLKFYALVLWRTRGWCRGCCGCSTSRTPRSATTPRTPRSCCASSAPWWRSGRPSSRPPPGRISGPGPAGSVTGAATRRTARASAAPRRPSRSPPPRTPCATPAPGRSPGRGRVSLLPREESGFGIGDDGSRRTAVSVPV